jgi:hypothetical protein
VGRVREAARARASWTAAVKRVQRSVVSDWVVLGRGEGGEMDRMETNSGLVYVGKWRCGTKEVRRKFGEGEVTMKTVVREGIWKGIC